MTATRRLAITPGEPAGIGPELVAALACRERASQWVVIADPNLLAERAQALGLNLQLRPFDPADHSLDPPGALRVLTTPLARPAAAGRPDPANATYVLETLRRGVDGCVGRTFDGLVTGPVHKGVINDADIPFSGHTEFLAERTGAEAVLMVLMAGTLRVALATTHLPLAAVPGAITLPGLERSLAILLADLRWRFAVARPRVLVTGLNPHAGEGGHLGREELDVIEPACERARERGEAVVGPLPADTVFTPATLEGADAVLAMYHDQGLPVLKHAGFGRAVNVTFGLPIVRTSVDHGTALDLAGSGRADTGSLAAAVTTAELMVGAARRQEDHDGFDG